MIKSYSATALYVFSIGAALLLNSCSKSADPINPKISSSDIPAVNGNIVTVSGTSGTTTGTGSTGATGATGSTGTTSSGTATGGGTTGTTTNSGSGSAGTTGSGGSTTSSSNNGDGGVPIGATNTIIVKVNGTTYTYNTPPYLMEFGLTTGNPNRPIGEFAIGAFVLTGSTDAFTMIVDDNSVGVQNVTSINMSSGNNIFDGSSGKTKITKFNLLSINKGTLQGTFDTTGTDANGNPVRIVGSYNISM